MLPKGVMRFMYENKQVRIVLLCLEDIKKEGKGVNCKTNLRAQ